MTVSSHTMGEDQPLPPMDVFQATFAVSLQNSGRPDSSGGTPVEPGLRNCGQLAAAQRTAIAVEAKETKLLRVSISSTPSYCAALAYMVSLVEHFISHCHHGRVR